MHEEEGMFNCYTVYFFEEFVHIDNTKAYSLCPEATWDHSRVANVPYLIV
jgi:hypothetical protein